MMELGIQTVSLNVLVDSPFWCRQFREDEEFDDLVESVKRIGVIEPPIVRSVNGKLEIVCGHRRVLAARKAQLKFVLVDIRRLSDEEVMEIQLMENIHRKDLSDFEKAKMLKSMLEKFGWKQKELAGKIGKSQPWVANHLRMLQLEQDENISREIIPKLDEGHARAILATPEEKRQEVVEKVEKVIEETGKPPTIREIQNSSLPSPEEMVECERCHVHVCKSEIKLWHNHNLCEKCEQRAQLNPELYAGYFKTLERAKENKVPTKEYANHKPFKESWEHRVQAMKVSPSKMDEAMLIRLQNNEKLHKAGWRIEFQKAYIKVICKSDVSLIHDKLGKEIAVFFDGLEAHKNRDFEDEANRQEAAFLHNLEILPLPYHAFTKTEENRLEKAVEEKGLEIAKEA